MEGYDEEREKGCGGSMGKEGVSKRVCKRNGTVSTRSNLKHYYYSRYVDFKGSIAFSPV